MRSNRFTVQDAGINSKAELDHFLNRIIFPKHSDTTLNFCEKNLVIPLFLLIPLIMMLILHKRIPTICYELDYMRNSIIYLHSLHQHGFQMH